MAPDWGLTLVKMNIIPPMKSTSVPVTVRRLVAMGNRSSTFSPRGARGATGMVQS